MGFDPKQVIDLLNKHKRGALSVDEGVLLKDWIAQSFENAAFFNEVDLDDRYFDRLHDDLLSKLRVFEDVKVRTDDFNHNLTDPDIHRATPTYSKPEQVPSSPTKVLTLTRAVRLAAAACVAGILFAGYLYLRPHNQLLQPTIALQPMTKAEVLPGGNKAILMLANGEKIILDSAANGLLATQGNAQIEKLKSGQLAYKLDNKTFNSAPAAPTFNSLSTPRGGQYQLTLPDGSEVWLNSESTLSYPVGFTGSERKVKLTGEGYFEIAIDAVRPFRVETTRGSVEVLGTHFNLSAYPDEKAEMTTLLEGKVRVHTPTRSVMLHPGEQAYETGSAMSSVLSVKHPNLQTITAWRRGFFNFYEADVLTVMQQLSRWYDVDYRFEGTPTTEKIDGLISRDLKLSEALAVLQNLHIHVTLVDRTIIIRP